MAKFLSLSLLLSVSFVLTGCYSMPTDEDFCLIPATNNPSITKQKDSNMVPSASY